MLLASLLNQDERMNSQKNKKKEDEKLPENAEQRIELKVFIFTYIHITHIVSIEIYVIYSTISTNFIIRKEVYFFFQEVETGVPGKGPTMLSPPAGLDQACYGIVDPCS